MRDLKERFNSTQREIFIPTQSVLCIYFLYSLSNPPFVFHETFSLLSWKFVTGFSLLSLCKVSIFCHCLLLSLTCSKRVALIFVSCTVKTNACYIGIPTPVLVKRVNQGKSVIWLFFKINISTIISMKRSR